MFEVVSNVRSRTRKSFAPMQYVPRVHVNHLRPYYKQRFRGGKVIPEGTEYRTVDERTGSVKERDGMV